MGACSSMEMVDNRSGAVMQPLPSSPSPQLHLSVHPSSHPTNHPSPAVAHYSPSLSPAPSSTLSPPSPNSRPELLSNRPNRHSSSTTSSISPSNLRLASLTLDGDHIDDASTPSAAAHSRAVEEKRTAEATTLQGKQGGADPRRTPSSLDDASPTAGGVRGRTMLNPRRQEKAAAAVDSERYSKAVEEEKTQPAAIEEKRGSSGLLSKIQQPHTKKQALPLELSADEKRLTSDSPILVYPVHTSPSTSTTTTSPPPDPKRLSALFSATFKKSASVDSLALPPAPAILTTRLPSEVEILDVIRVLGQSQAVSAMTLSQYTRCVPPTLAGPLPRSPRGSWQAGGGSVVGVGVGTGVGCCAKLHCDGCHMDVMMLDHHRWVEGASVAVFSEFYPDVQRLRGSLVASVGSRAYCCACSWVDVKGPVAVEEAVEGEERKLQWVCAGHQ